MSDLTDRQRLQKLNELEHRLEQTTEGFDPRGVYWRSAIKILDELQADAARPVIPKLGPVYPGGKSILLEDCTHMTSVLGWPAFDTAFPARPPGPRLRDIIAPEACSVYDDTSDAVGGDAFYVKGVSGIKYWIAHISFVPKKGTKFRKGQKMTRTSPEHPRIHAHIALDVRAITGGRHLKSHTNYTHGAPLIGKQLATMMV